MWSVCPVCLSITTFQFPGECFWCICRFKPVLLALFGDPWIRIICPQLIGRRIFFSPAFGNQDMKVLHGFPPNLQHSNVTKCVNANKPKKKLRIFPPTTPPFSTFFPHRLEFLLFFLVHAVYVPLLIYFSSHQIVSMMVYKQCPKDLIASASVLFSGLAEIRMSQKWEVVGRLMSLGDPPHFSSYLMDQVFLQDFLTTVETPYQLCTQEADHFSTTSGKWAAVHLPRVQVSFTDYSHCTIVAFSTNSSSCLSFLVVWLGI